MTTERFEIVIEGGADTVHWREYQFRWKPGDPARRPPFVAPHMPRLDWQMWFAALNPEGARDWLVPLLRHLLQGTPEVLDLLGENPFPSGPPRRSEERRVGKEGRSRWAPRYTMKSVERQLR